MTTNLIESSFSPIGGISLVLLMRLLQLRPDLRAEIVAELKRRGVQVVEDQGVDAASTGAD